MLKYKRVQTFLSTTNLLFVICGRSLLVDFRSLFFAFGWPLMLVLLVGLFFFKSNHYLVFSGLTLMSCLVINLSLVAFQVSDWRNSVFFTRIKVTRISLPQLLIAFAGFYSLLTIISWIWTFAWICLLVLAKSNARQVSELIRSIRWGWQVLVLLVAGLATLPIGISLGFALNNAESVQFVSSLILTVILSLAGAMFPIGLITRHSLVLKYISYLLYFRYIVNLNQIYWNRGQLPRTNTPYNDGYQLWWLWVAVATFLVGFWMMASLLVIRRYRRR